MDTSAALPTLQRLHPLDWAVIIAYLGAAVGVGVYFGRFTKSTKDFFLGGQRFSWWVGAVSCVATLVGSYSFINYSEVGYNFGVASATNYTNDWFVLPLFLLAWVPIIYYGRLTSVPEYFERRFDRRTRIAALVITLIYLQGYIGINLYTIGVAMKGILGWDVMASAAVISVLTGLVIYAGGATSVMMADLLQAFLLLGAGVMVFALGVDALGGFGAFWRGLEVYQRLPFARFVTPPEYHFVGEFWGDAITGTIAFYFLNQSVLLRFLSVKSVEEARKTMLFSALVLMPVAAVAVGGAGWVARAMVTQGLMPPIPYDQAKDVFIAVVRRLCPPGVFGFVMAALLAALMSTLEALINAVSTVAVNDIYRPFVRPGRTDEHYLAAARLIAVAANVAGILLIPVFAGFKSIYQAFSYFTAVVTPPMVAVIALGAAWPRFTPSAAFWTLVLGSAATLLSVFIPELVTPFAHGEPASTGHSYMRSLFGLAVSAGVGVALTFLTRPKPEAELSGLTLATVAEARRRFKGGEPGEAAGAGAPVAVELDHVGPALARLPAKLMEELGVRPGDLVYVCDARWWLGGLRSAHLKAADAAPGDAVQLHPEDAERGGLLPGRPVRVEKIL